MKNLMKTSLFAFAVVLGTAFSACAEQIFNDANFLKKSRVAKVDENGVVYFQGQTLLKSEKFSVDPAKKYRLNLSVQAPVDQQKSMIHLGYEVYTADGRIINSYNVSVNQGTLTEVAADARKGDDFLLVKDGSKFRKGYYSIVAGAKADLSDLPNFNVAALGVRGIEKQEGSWKILLKNKLNQNLTAGTMIRQHKMGGYFYAGGSRMADTAWKTMKGLTQGFAPSFFMPKWPMGTASARVVILVDWNNKKVKTLLKDMSLTAE